MPQENSPMRRQVIRSFMSVLAIAPLLVISGGCDDYLDRRETVTLGVGDSIEVNKATQSINRWPYASHQDRWLSDGERARIAVENYRTRTQKPLQNLGTSETSGNGTQGSN